MLATMLTGVLTRDLKALRRELEAYDDERGLWAMPKGVSNSAGTLAMHLAGNLRAFIGAQLGGTGYVRDRDAEFNRRDVPRSELLAQLGEAILTLTGETQRADLASCPESNRPDIVVADLGELQHLLEAAR